MNRPKRWRSVLTAMAVALMVSALSAQRSPFEGTKAGDEREIANVKFRWAPPGTFRMGSPPSESGRRADEGPVTVKLSRGFWIGQYEVTQGQWKKVMGPLPQEPDKGAGDDVPVYWVNFPEAEEFCARLTKQARASGELPADWEVRLPAEAQWEYACRAGTATATHFGERMTKADANIGAPYPGDGPRNPPGGSVKAGSYAPNAWGLYDMHGSVWEWCRDWYHRQLPGGVDPDLSTEKGEVNRDGTYSRVRRSGAWVEPGWANRSAMRLRYEPERRSDHIGFRVVAVRTPLGRR